MKTGSKVAELQQSPEKGRKPYGTFWGEGASSRERSYWQAQNKRL